MEALNRASPPRHQKPGKFRMTRALYHQLGERGAFEGLKVELLEGEIIVMSPMDAAHAYPLQELEHLLHVHLPPGLRVRTQMPIAPDDENEPEPDFAIVPAGTQREGGDATSALLAVEVSNTSLRDDLQRKARIYARAGIPEYWVVDVKKRELVVHRSPVGERYRSVKHLKDLSEVTSTAVPGLVLDLRNIFIKR
ncbi:MAG: Uma2 family endonuclease [Archangium sp.]|nr:Uma2 family endonuclease [Archangium sp.]